MARKVAINRFTTPLACLQNYVKSQYNSPKHFTKIKNMASNMADSALSYALNGDSFHNNYNVFDKHDDSEWIRYIFVIPENGVPYLIWLPISLFYRKAGKILKNGKKTVS